MAIPRFNLTSSEGSSIIKTKIFDRRAFIIMLGQFFGYVIIVLRLMNLQLFHRRKYRSMSDSNQYRPSFIIPLRGKILDRNGNALAYSRFQHQVILDYHQFKNLTVIVGKIIPLLNQNRRPANFNRFITFLQVKIKQDRRNNLTLWRSLTKNEIARIEYNLHALPGISITRHNHRHYPLGLMAANIIGHLRTITKSNTMSKNGTLLKLATQEYKTGNSGIEKSKNSTLRGHLGLEIKQVDANSRIIGQNIHTNPINGMDVKLTIDYDLQKKACDLMNGKFGSITLLDLKDGSILTSTSSPSFDPNMLSNDYENKTHDELRTEHNAFINKAFNMPYNPGSTFKIVSALNAMIHGFDPNKEYCCTGKFRFGNRTFHCLNAHAHGKVDLVKAIARSCNCYFYNLATSTDIDELHDTAVMLGLNQQYPISNLSNRKGIMPNREWKKNRFGQKWLPGETLNIVIGQGYVESTPLQLAIVAGRIATGKIVMPHIIAQNDTLDKFNSLDIDHKHLEILRHCMFEVFHDPFSTCRWFYNTNPLYQVSGKTGTTQIISQRIDLKDIVKGNVKHEVVSHGLFVGYAPSNNPRFAITVVLEHGVFGTRCAPLATSLFRAAIDKYIK